MINYNSSKPNGRFWVLKMIKDNIRAGSKLVPTNIDANRGDDLVAQAFVDGSKKMILILNKRNKPVTIKLPPEWKGARSLSVNPSSNDGPPLESTLTDAQPALEPFEVKLIILPSR
jgi:hypothetical protein